MKKILALLLAALLAIGLIACGKDNGGDTTTTAKKEETKKEDETQKPDEPVEVYTVKISIGSGNQLPSEEATVEVEEYMDDYILNTLGINDLRIDLSIMSNAEASTQLGLSLAGAEELDIISSRDTPTYVANGYLVDITPYKDTLLKGAFDVLGDWMVGTKVGDSYYGIPVYKGMSLAYKFFYDHSLFDPVVDIDDVTDMDTLGDAMAKLKEVYPDEHFQVHLYTIASWYQTQDHTCTVGGRLCTVGTDPTLSIYYESDAYETAVRKAYEWNQLGYCDPEGTKNTLSYDALVLSGSAKGCLMGHAYSDETCDLMFDMNSTAGIDFGCKTLWYTDISNTQGCIGIAYTSKHPEAAMRVLNLIYTDEFIMSAIIYGKEGVSWIWNDDHSSIIYPEGLNLGTVPYTCLYLCGAFGNQFNLYGMDGNTSEADKGFMKELIDKAFKGPYFGFTPVANAVQTEVAAVTNVVNQYNNALTYGELDPDEYLPIYRKELKDAGIEAILEEYSKQGEEWRKVNGKD